MLYWQTILNVCPGHDNWGFQSWVCHILWWFDRSIPASTLAPCWFTNVLSRSQLLYLYMSIWRNPYQISRHNVLSINHQDTSEDAANSEFIIDTKMPFRYMVKNWQTGSTSRACGLLHRGTKNNTTIHVHDVSLIVRVLQVLWKVLQALDIVVCTDNITALISTTGISFLWLCHHIPSCLIMANLNIPCLEFCNSLHFSCRSYGNITEINVSGLYRPPAMNNTLNRSTKRKGNATPTIAHCGWLVTLTSPWRPTRRRYQTATCIRWQMSAQVLLAWL